ncbi:LOW QUALITY PROTEIN: uncharacterized protein LOC124434310 [Xenia sp. Carnegie-2017]|uniref:LOW QUALITY PROTEIN: uncharacterized protein LOC124434310 n=1 Tax=Xenia sp. Carnegie-2017 TaxID=2897299 RepID=UPI001F042304|nr:LOW QUALITY PROTEIN: uncharacterized protein LOC124434310 [Xenia sp. Carnegie-2017]
MNQVSLVEQLKEVVKAQNESLRQKHNEIKTLRTENSRLSALVQELEIENEGLKGLLEAFQKDKCTNGQVSNGGKNDETQRPRTLALSSPLNTPSSNVLWSPEKAGKTLIDADKTRISIKVSSTPNARCALSPKKPSFSDRKTRNSFYELSPDISDKHVQMLEKKYGGKERAHKAAKIIQQQFRRWSMKRTYARLRTQSEARRSSWKSRRSRRSSSRSPSRSCSISPVRSPSINDGTEMTLKLAQISEQKLGQSPSRDDLKPISTDINIDSDFEQVQSASGKPLVDMSVRKVSEDISSIGQQKVIDEVFQQILFKTKEGVTEGSRSNSLSSLRGSQITTVDESPEISVETSGAQLVEGVDCEGNAEQSTEITKQILNNAESEIIDNGDGVSIDDVKGEIVDNVDGKTIDNMKGETVDYVDVKTIENMNCESTDNVDDKIIHSIRSEPMDHVDVKTVENVECEPVDDVEGEICAQTDDVVMANNDERPSVCHDEMIGNDAHLINESKDSFDSFNDNHSRSWPVLNHLYSDDTSSLGGCSLSPSSSIMQTFYENRAKDVRIGINHFNRKPKKGMDYLVDTGVLHEDDVEGICKFLKEEPGINKQKIGDYLGDLRNPLSMIVLRYFVKSMVLEGREVDDALRHFQTFFRMPGEAQKIERIVEEFSKAYVDANPDKVSNNPDTVLVLSFAIIMLNTDLHSPNVKRKMSKEEFMRNLRGTNDGGDLPSEQLSAIYDRVEKREFRTGPDNLHAIQKYEKQILGKVPWTTLALPHRQLRQVTTLYEIQQGGRKKEKPHHRVVFIFNDLLVVTKERGQAGQKGIHYYSYKSSYQLIDIKFALFRTNYFKYGVRIISKINDEVLINFHAKKEDIRSTFVNELRDCIEETCTMENERIAGKKAPATISFGRRNLDDTISMTLLRSNSNGLKDVAPDTLSLVNAPGSIAMHGQYMGSSLLSSSLQDLHQTGDIYVTMQFFVTCINCIMESMHICQDGNFYDENLQKSTSMASFDFGGSDTTSGIGSDLSSSNGSVQNVTKRFSLLTRSAR